VSGPLFHDLRRSAIRNMIRAGVPQSVAKRISGHKAVSVFLRYDITSDDDLRAAMQSVASAQAYAATATVTKIASAEERSR
jgi:hypothetical protein